MRSFGLQLVVPILAFAVGTGLAAVAGMDGLGRAATIGTLAFALALVAVLVRYPARAP